MVTYNADGTITLVDDPSLEAPRTVTIPAGLTAAQIVDAIVSFFAGS